MSMFLEQLEPYEPIDTPPRLNDKRKMELTRTQQLQLLEARKKFGPSITGRPIWRKNQTTNTFSMLKLDEKPELDHDFFAYMQLVLRVEILRYVQEHNKRIAASRQQRSALHNKLLTIPKETQFEQFCWDLEYVILGCENEVFRDPEHIREVIAEFVTMAQQELLASNAYYYNTRGSTMIKQIEKHAANYEGFSIPTSCDLSTATGLDSSGKIFDRFLRVWEQRQQKNSREESLELRLESIRLQVCMRIWDIYEEVLSQGFVSIPNEHGQAQKLLMTWPLHLPRSWQVERLLEEYHTANRLRRYEKVYFDKMEIAYFIHAASKEIEDILTLIN